MNIKHTLTKLPTRLIRLWTDSYLRLRLRSRIALPGNGERSISVAIPFYNNAKMGHLALFNILDDPRVGEIVVLDDGSDPREFQKLKKRLAPFAEKVRLFRREQNVGVLANKMQVVELCRSKWVVLLDYDNTATSDYLDCLFNVEHWDPNTIYCSAFAYPDFDFRDRYGGKIINFSTARSMLKAKTFYGPFFNDGNYFVNRTSFLNTLKPFRTYDVPASDVLFVNYLWLSSGRVLEVLADSWYIHRVHKLSTWLAHRDRSIKDYRAIQELIRKNIPVDVKTLDAAFRHKELNSTDPILISLSDTQ